MSDTTETPGQQPEDAASGSENSNQQPEVMPSLEESLKAAELKAQEHYDAWMYARAALVI